MDELEMKELYRKWQLDKSEKYKKALGAMPDDVKNFIGNELNNPIGKAFSAHVRAGGKPSEFICSKMNMIFGDFIRPDFKEYLLWAADNMISWQYSSSYWRRSYRCSDFSAYRDLLSSMIAKFGRLSYFESDIMDIITDDLPEPEKSHAEHNSYWSSVPYEYVVAAELDRNNEEMLKAVEDIIMGEGTRVTTDLIRGIFESKNAKAHELLGKLLLAAQLQEGLRQAICENADCGSPEGFMYILGIIVENDLIRFSSVKRAAATWCGLYSEDPAGFDRIAKKTVKLMYDCLTDEKQRDSCLSGEDAMDIYIALWACSFADVIEGIKVCRRLVKNGTKHQRMVCGTFIGSLDSTQFENECGKFALENFRNENDTAALFIDWLIPNASAYIDSLSRRMIPQWGNDKECGMRLHADLDEFFESEDEARRFYDILKELRASIPKKEIRFEPCVFPWKTAVLSKNKIVHRLAYIASALKDNSLMDEVSAMLSELTDSRDDVLVLLTAFPETEIQQNVAVASIADRESYTSSRAYKIVTKTLKLSGENYVQLENMLKYKSADVRKNALSLLIKLDDDRLFACCERLLSDKNGEKRTGGLDLVLQVKADKKRSALFERLTPLVAQMSRDVSKEQILIDEILSDGDTEPQEGFGLYSDIEETPPEIDMDYVIECRKLFAEIFPDGCFGKKLSLKFKKEPDYVTALKKLDALIAEHANDEFTDRWGEKALLGNAGWLNTPDSKLPFEDMWLDFYEKEIRTPELLYRMLISLRSLSSANINNSAVFKRKSNKIAEKLIGSKITEDIPLKYADKVGTIVSALCGSIWYDNSDKLTKIPTEMKQKLAVAAAEWLLGLPEKDFIIDLTGDTTDGNRYNVNSDVKRQRLVFYHPQIAVLTYNLSWQYNDCTFRTIFPIRYALWKKADFSVYDHYYDEHPSTLSMIGTNEMIRACALGIISDNTMYKWLFGYMGETRASGNYRSGFSDVLSDLSNDIKFIRERDKVVSTRGYSYRYAVTNAGSDLVGRKEEDEFTENDSKVLKKARKTYEDVIEAVLKVELKRGDSETMFSQSVRGIQRIYGAEHFVRILAAMGKDTFDRSSYYPRTKKECLSHLISVCVPDDGDNADILRELVKKTDITEKRLIEAAMYSPEWIEIMEEYLGWEGFRSGCYYFMAHMNESFDDKRKAVIAKFTPLEPEELQGGAFDIGWFKQAHSELGEKRFSVLYDAAKYISDGAKHSRARKYADAVMGKMDETETENKIDDKRNKDLLMAYSLIPINGDDDVMRRYLFLQKFLKESKQFGAQRRASESAAVDIAMRNLATAAGIADVTRLKLRMETKFFESIRPLFERHDIGEVTVWLEVNDGKTELRCEKGGKMLKSVPAKLKKDEYITELNATKKQLTEQYRRTRIMLEQSMEDRSTFTLGEINMLKTNPVASALTENLVYAAEGKCLLIKDAALVNADGEVYSSDESCEITIAHPIDMFREGTWRNYQKYLFDNKLVQPFRQVFRELYVKTDEELECSETRRYAGNQIQVKKTIACLKSRRWVCDIEDGLQKVYFKENLVAKLYALADWFSPSDIEAPTLEWVGFYDRNTYKPVKIKDVPDIIFSEVMRDADLAVSVCHAGEVDPEHSHSTIEMRAAILEFTLPLFKLGNCEISGSHVLIKGSRAEYSVNLGSGVCHIRGGAMLNILPVHSQHRGRIFLPFADDDPKTAEVISKVLLLAEDKKIKDPYIISQIGI